MAKKKVYAVRRGRRVGILETWDECRASVDGYPGAQYKSFPTKEEALAYLGAGKDLPDADAASMEGMENVRDDHVTAYVDGSFDPKLGKYAFGCVMLLPDGSIVRRSGNGDNPESVSLRNVTGEMLGAMHAVKWCIDNRYSSVEICYDYSGIEMWATGQWQAKKDLTKKYAEYMNNCSRKIVITFQKIAAHTGDQYNEEADQLAKAALAGEIK